MKKNKNFSDLTLLIPTKRESESLPVFLKELKFINCKKIVILDSSDLETINSIKNFKVKILFQKKSGYGSALIEGIKKTTTKFLCIINADGSMNPQSVINMLNKIKKFDYDFIFASRYQGKGGSEDDNLLTFVGNKFFTWFGNFFLNLNITDILYTFILGKTLSFNNLKLKCFDFRICPEIPIKVTNMGYKYLCIDDFKRKRIKGK